MVFVVPAVPIPAIFAVFAVPIPAVLLSTHGFSSFSGSSSSMRFWNRKNCKNYIKPHWNHITHKYLHKNVCGSMRFYAVPAVPIPKSTEVPAVLIPKKHCGSSRFDSKKL